MKKKYFTVCLMVFAFTSIAFADEALIENTELQSQEQATEVQQSQIDMDGTEALVQAMHREQFRHTNMVRIEKIIEDAQDAGLPTKPLTDKVYEGIAKNVDEESIVLAVSRVRNRYMHAYRQALQLAVDPEEEENLGDLIAGAYTAGLRQDECDTIMAALQTRTRTMNRSQAQDLAIRTIATARIMAHREVRSETISDVLVSALNKSYKAADMQELEHSFIDRARYGSAEHVAQLFSDGINRGLGAKELGNRYGGNGFNDQSRGTSAGSGGATSGGSKSSGNTGGTSGGSSTGSRGGSGNSGGNSKGSGGGAGGGRGR